MNYPIVSLISIVCALLFSGCTALKSAESSSTPAVAEAVTQAPATAAEEKTKAAAGTFEPDTLYELLVAELAAHRQQPEVTLEYYLKQARKTQDLGIIQRAMQVAQYTHDNDAVREMSMLWADQEPNNPKALQPAILAMLSKGDHAAALPLLERALMLDDPGTLHHIASQAERLSPELRQGLIAVLGNVALQRPDDPLLLATRGVLLKQEGDSEAALKLAQQALEHQPSLRQAILLEAEMQHELGHTDTALGHLREALEENDDKQMRLFYTRLLFEKQQFEQAMRQSNQLLEAHPEDNYLLYFLAVLMLENNQLEDSKALFEDLRNRVHSSTPHYYLGRIAALQEQPTKAIEHFLQVRDGPTVLASYSQIAELLESDKDKSRLQEIFHGARTRHNEHSPALFTLEAGWLLDHGLDNPALILLNEALSQHPDNTRLRYARAMLGEQMGDLVLLERDLRHVLDLEPENAMALNALGYTLTDHTDRHQEAFELISRALVLKPDDPAILDSMGWVYYKLGQYDKALDYLHRAYESFPDAEIATHLGKAYWVLGDTERALEIWRKALDRDPDSELLLKALEEAQGDL